MKNFVNIAFHGYPESNVDSIVRGFTKSKELVVFSVSPDEGTMAALHGTELKLPKELSEINDLKTLIKYLKHISMTVENNVLKTENLENNAAAYMNTTPLAAKEACSAEGCAGYGGCVADAGCAADGCAAYGGCLTRAICTADGCGGYGGCAADGGCVTRGCAADGGCGANVICAADVCAGHACGVDACPANVNVGPCAVDIPVCPIIL
ncbi:MAG TPA: hypothetical protein VHT34_04495 [Clostridia bacterium]|nr:hypothetical protein [Clostridia bacterium]